MFRAVLMMICLLAAAGGPAQAQTAAASVRICPADGSPDIPDFSAADCRTATIDEIDPQGREIWVELHVVLSEATVRRDAPTGLFVSAAASTRAYLNGVPLGANGRPGRNRADESPGRMDAVFFVPPQAMQAGSNRIVLNMASHHGRITFRYPLHQVLVAPYAGAQERLLQSYIPTLFPLGAFGLGLLVFGFRALRTTPREPALIVLAITLFASLQLLAEASRGYLAYAYPFHEVRLLLILVGAGGLSLMVLAHVAQRFLPWPAGWRWLGWAVIAGITLIAVLLTRAFDPKTLMALFLPLAAGLLVAAWAAWRRRPAALTYAAGLALVCAALVWLPLNTLNFGIYYAAGALVILLLIEQAAALIRARETLIAERERGARLELALERARQQDAPREIQLTSAGRIQRLAAHHIVHLQAAGDYVELSLAGGKRELFTLTLSEAESRLPDTFLRIHRSHIVNTDFVKSLTRAANGVGELELSDGSILPVSRRIMPKVRSALRD